MKNQLFLFLLLGLPCSTLAQQTVVYKGEWVKLKHKTPIVSWQRPQTVQTTVEKAALTVIVCVQSTEPLISYGFVHNGKELSSISRGFKRVTCGQEVSEELTLQPGNNEVHFVAVNAGGTTVSESHYITYKKAVTDTVSQQQAPKRLALVVANATYLKYPLKNSVNDGLAICERLEKLGFEVTLRENQTRKDLKRSVDTFMASLTDKSVGLFFYAGHGLMVNGNNYVQPVDADPAGETDVEFDCFPLRQLIARMEEANPGGSNVVFWDACRNNPYRSWTRGAGGPVYAATNPPVGTIIVYATEPGKSAQDGGDQKNGLFTSELIKHIDAPGQDIFELIDKIDHGLEERGFKQPPYIEGRLRGRFFFNTTTR